MTLVLCAVLCFTLNAFAIKVHQPVAMLATASSLPATQPTLPAINFSSVGTVSSIQMTGNANWVYGSDQQTGAVILQAYANGQSRMELQLTAGSRIETQNPFSDPQRQCTWAGFDGAVHNSAPHHCWIDTVWFLPQITMQVGTGATDDTASFSTSADGKTIRFHHERHPLDVADDQTAQLLAHLSAVDLDVNAATGLPASLAFAAHPDNDAGTDLSVEIRYSAYSNFGGVIIPTHIQKFINHALVLDLQISNVQVQLAAPAATSPASAVN